MQCSEPARETDKAEVIAVASRDAGRAQRYAHEHGIERAYGSYEELLADPDVEAVSTTRCRTPCTSTGRSARP